MQHCSPKFRATLKGNYMKSKYALLREETREKVKRRALAHDKLKRESGEIIQVKFNLDRETNKKLNDAVLILKKKGIANSKIGSLRFLINDFIEKNKGEKL